MQLFLLSRLGEVPLRQAQLATPIATLFSGDRPNLPSREIYQALESAEEQALAIEYMGQVPEALAYIL